MTKGPRQLAADVVHELRHMQALYEKSESPRQARALVMSALVGVVAAGLMLLGALEAWSFSTWTVIVVPAAIGAATFALMLWLQLRRRTL